MRAESVGMSTERLGRSGCITAVLRELDDRDRFLCYAKNLSRSYESIANILNQMRPR